MRVHRRNLLTAPRGDRAAQFGGANYLSVANPSGVFIPAFNTDLHVYFWFVIDVLPPGVDGYNMVKCGPSPVDVTKDSWGIFFDAADRLGMFATDGATYAFLIPAVTLSVATWYFTHCHWDNSGGTAALNMSLYDTGGSLGSFGAGGHFLNNPSPSQPLFLGGINAPQIGLQGRMDKLGIWHVSSVETPPDELDLWNGGAGMTGAAVFATPALVDNVIAYYDFDELTGALTWADHGGVHPATATGTVVSVPPVGQF